MAKTRNSIEKQIELRSKLDIRYGKLTGIITKQLNNLATPMHREATAHSQASKELEEPSHSNLREMNRKLGQFMTPSIVANHMASRLMQGVYKETIRVLEPAAGSGALAEAIFEYIARQKIKPRRVKFILYEIDQLMRPSLSALAIYMRNKAKELGFSVSCSIRIKDFLLNVPEEKFDIVIANPPFFKVRIKDSRSIAYKHVVHGQPNIYGLFMAACAPLLSDGGRYCFLTPRSWTSGSYFVELRKFLFNHLQLEAVHLFQNRSAPFKKDRIQQEMMITWATAQRLTQEDVMVSSSTGLTDLATSQSALVPITNIFTSRRCETINLPTTLITYSISTCRDTLETIGLNVSTGKVVPFRAKEWIKNQKSEETVPLLWMQHVRRGEVNWPINRSGEYFTLSESSKKLLIPQGNYVLIRRFSPRDREHWITATALLNNKFQTYIGVENHVNYVHGVDNPLTRAEAVGLSMYLNSSPVSYYFASRIGHTQINATDLKALPVPSRSVLCTIGKKFEKHATQSEVDEYVNYILLDQTLMSYESLSDG